MRPLRLHAPDHPVKGNNDSSEAGARYRYGGNGKVVARYNNGYGKSLVGYGNLDYGKGVTGYSCRCSRTGGV